MSKRDRTIGVVLDFSKSSKTTLQWAIDYLLQDGYTLLLIHVQSAKNSEEARNSLWTKSDPLYMYYLSEFKEVEVMMKYRVDSEIVKILDNVADIMGDVNFAFMIDRGDPREKIVEVAEKWKLDYLVMGCRGLGTIQRLLPQESVTNYVISTATCPVIVLKDPSLPDDPSLPTRTDGSIDR